MLAECPPSTSSDGSRTITLRDSQPIEDEHDDGSDLPSPTVGMLRLRGAARSRIRQHVEWSEDVIDNEGCGRKKSKICCIYHKPKEFDESSDESSDSDSDADEGCNDPGHRHHRHYDRPQDHAGPPEGDRSGAEATRPPPEGERHQPSGQPRSNAYETAPQAKGKGKG